MKTKEQDIEWLNKAIELYNKGYSFLRIGKELDIDRKKISKVLKQYGYNAKYSFETTNGIQREKKIWRKYSFNENFFETIDTEEKAYWLGFMYADGYVNSQKSSCELRLKDSDKEHIQKFLNCINGNMPIRPTNKIDKSTGKIYKGWSIQINSQKFKNDLIKNGCFENKSLILNFPDKNIVPNNLIHHFIRGYIDGDGSYTLKKNVYHGKNKDAISYSIAVEILGTYEFCEGCINALHLHKNKIHPLRKGNIKNSKRIIYAGPYALNIIKYIYKDAHIYLDRKYEKLIHLFAVIGQNPLETYDD